MRIAFDHQTFALQTYGGISRYFSRLAENLIDIGEDVGIFAPFHRNAHLLDLPRAAVRGRHLRDYPPKTTRAFYMLNRLLDGPSMRWWKPDIVHETYYLRAASGVRGAPLVLTVYDMIHELFSSGDPTSAMKRQAVARADHIICISRSTQRDLVSLFGVDERKTSVTLLGVDPPLPGDGNGVRSERPFLLFVGGRAGYKNFEGFLKAVAASSLLRREMDIVAFGGGAFTPGEMQAIDALGFSGQVTYASGDDRLLGDYYRRAAALVYPSLYEGFGLPPLEAMSYDCAVLCSNTSSLPEVVGDAAELFDPKDEMAIANAIEKVVASPSRRDELLEKGRERVREFTWRKCARETLAVYKSVGIKR